MTMMTDQQRIAQLEEKVKAMESYIKELQWNIEYKWGLDFMGENNANMYHFIKGAYER